MSENRNLDAAAQRLQRRLVFLKRRALALDVCLAGALAALLAAVVIRLAAWSISLLLVYGGILGLVVLVLLLLAWRVRVSALSVLQRADLAQGLQERLSTAYEYLRDQVGNPFLPGLVAEAERVAPQANPQAVFPGRLPRRAWAIPVLLAASLGLVRLDMTPIQFEERTQAEVAPEVARAGERLERWGRRLEELAKQQRLNQSLILARHMQNLGRRLRRQGGEKAQAVQRISNLSQYLQRMRQELRERALMSEVGAMVARAVLASGKSVKQELQDILQMLQNESLSREMAVVAEQGVMRLSRYLGQNSALEQLAQNLRAGNLKAARQLLQDIIRRQQATEEMEHLERAQRALEYSARSIRRGEASGDASETGTPRMGNRVADGATPDSGDETLSEDIASMEEFSTPGFDEGFGAARHTRKGASQHLRESDQPFSRVPVRSGEGAMRLAYIRYLPVPTPAHVPLQEVVVQYTRAAEEVLSREQIPRAYREQVKQYFLAIGMMSPDKP